MVLSLHLCSDRAGICSPGQGCSELLCDFLPCSGSLLIVLLQVLCLSTTPSPLISTLSSLSPVSHQFSNKKLSPRFSSCERPLPYCSHLPSACTILPPDYCWLGDLHLRFKMRTRERECPEYINVVDSPHDHNICSHLMPSLRLAWVPGLLLVSVHLGDSLTEMYAATV